MRISDWSSDVCSSGLLQRRCISRWSAYAEFLQLFDQARLAITRRWLSEMLIGGNRFLRRRIAFPKARQQLRIFIFAVVDAFLIQRQKARKDHDLPGRTQTGPASRSEEHTSELQSLMRISYAVFC